LQGVSLDQIPVDLEEIQKIINSLTAEELKEISQALVKIDKNVEVLVPSAELGRKALEGLSETGESLSRTAEEVNNLKN
jgi:hypothetical protein